MATSRSEGVKLKPFIGAQRVQDLLDDALSFTVESNLGKDKLPNGYRMTLPPKYIETLGLSISLSGGSRDLSKLLDELYGDSESFVWALLGRDTKRGILRETVILASGALPALDHSVEVKAVGSTSIDSPISNTFTGFELEFLILDRKSVV